MARTDITIDEMTAFCKRKGIVYPTSEIYGSMAGFWDFGPYGVEISNNLKQQWWKYHVQEREDIVGIDGAIIAHPKVWEASGHVGCFADLMLTCSKCKGKVRADTFIEDSLKIAADGMKSEEINDVVNKNGLKCPTCKGVFEEVKDFNLMFTTNVGPVVDEKSKAYLRPETAQLIFSNFRLVFDNARLKLPFGIAQIGKSFRNEISPRNFLFRCREFEQLEIEYFIHPDKGNECPFMDEILDHEAFIYSADMQENEKPAEKMKIKDAIEKGIMTTKWHAYWLAKEHKWFVLMGADPDNFRLRQHLSKEKSHYAVDTWDLEYKFPFGYKELLGIANRSDFDLQQHIKHSKKDLSIFDEESKSKVVPHVVAEPSLGLGRAFLVFMFDAYDDDKDRGNVVLHLNPRLAPFKAAVLPLVNKEKIPDVARKIFTSLNNLFPVIYDKSGSIGRRYARNDELGTPYCITVDFESIDNHDVTIRDRDSTEQKRIKIDELEETIRKLVIGKITFKDLK
ncbi:glycine--tRNA ligase [Candidatus Woesearchaeota archaeon CG11_big_fil_rev_8_21_14_0_20_43_8]|nr:MAG: glycine--tRNA ligase [Candidatus Woesearchaeota archaeon CG11_big_fil_rev_8_21_14_0_20_43_8]